MSTFRPFERGLSSLPRLKATSERGVTMLTEYEARKLHAARLRDANPVRGSVPRPRRPRLIAAAISLCAVLTALAVWAALPLPL